MDNCYYDFGIIKICFEGKSWVLETEIFMFNLVNKLEINYHLNTNFALSVF